MLHITKSNSDFFVDLLSPWAKVTSRKMFGGLGLYREGLIFAIVVEGALCFKVNEGNRRDYENAGSEPFIYEAKGRRVAMSYWRVPEEVMDSEELCIWAERAYQAALNKKKRAK